MPTQRSMNFTDEQMADVDAARQKVGLRNRSEYVRQAVSLRLYLDKHGWTEDALRTAHDLIHNGAWKD